MVTTKTTCVKTLIIGGGITGLATAYALQKQGNQDYLVLEAKPVPGGLCATTFSNGYYFDYSGHFLHVHTPLGKQLITDLLGKNIKQHTRNAYVYTNGMQVPVPFQTNLWALYPELRELIVNELSHKTAAHTAPAHFEQWCLDTFGCTLYEAFFRPYNEKLWGRPLTEITADWCTPFIPVPQRKEILAGAQHKPVANQGYNTHFYYPKTGGCGALINSLVRRVKHLRLNTPVTRVNLKKKTVQAGNEVFRYEHLVNTIALPQFVNMLDGHQPLKQAAAGLEAQAVTVYHLAIARAVNPFGWIYFPDSAQPFYRVGLASHFAPDSVPRKDTSLFYIELPGLPPATPETERKIWDGLYQKGIVNRDDEPLFSAWQSIPYAYVIFNKTRAKTVPALLNTLQEHGCYCAGRYGRWEYSFMESSLLQGVELAQKLVR